MPKINETLENTANKVPFALGDKPATLNEFVNFIAEEAQVTRKTARAFIDLVPEFMGMHFKKKLDFTWPNLFKAILVQKKGTPAGEKVNPFTKKLMQVAAKPEYTTVRVRALSRLKKMPNVDVASKDADLG